MKVNPRESWEDGLIEEIKFWRKWFTDDKHMHGRELRMSRNRKFQFSRLVNKQF